MMNQERNTTDLILADSLKELVLTKPVEKITIKEITDKAGVIRPTFYNHFQDKYELLEWIIHREILDPMQPLIQNGLINQAVLLLFTSMEHNREFYMRLSRMDGPITFDDLAVKCMHELLENILSSHPKNKTSKFPWVSADLLAEYYARSLCFAAKLWIRQGMNVPPQDMADAYEYLMGHTMEEVLNELG